MVSLEEVDKLKVPELKAACKDLGLDVNGNKAELQARLKEALASTAAAEPAEEAAEEPQLEEVTEAPAEEETAAPAGKHAKIVFTENPSNVPDKIEVIRPEKLEGEKVLSEEERKKLRADRFKDPEIEKQRQRAERFNLSHPDIDKEKKQQRALKFGIVTPEMEDEKKKKRAERFNIVDEETKKKQRLDKFKALPNGKPALVVSNDSDFEAKKQARAARFGAK